MNVLVIANSSRTRDDWKTLIKAEGHDVLEARQHEDAAVVFNEYPNIRLVILSMDCGSQGTLRQFRGMIRGHGQPVWLVGLSESETESEIDSQVKALTDAIVSSAATHETWIDLLAGLALPNNNPESEVEAAMTSTTKDGRVPALDADGTGNRPVASTSNTPDLKGVKILYIDDVPDNQRLVLFFLSKVGAEIEMADDGHQGVERALAAAQSNRPFDLVLMDMQMPVMDGYEATAALRAAGFAQPIIAVTAHAMAGDRQKCMDAGCDEYLTKPVDRRKLWTLILQQLEPKRLEVGERGA
ncbi:MAG: response regulator [Planctomycetota bacterium]